VIVRIRRKKENCRKLLVVGGPTRVSGDGIFRPLNESKEEQLTRVSNGVTTFNTSGRKYTRAEQQRERGGGGGKIFQKTTGVGKEVKETANDASRITRGRKRCQGAVPPVEAEGSLLKGLKTLKGG